MRADGARGRMDPRACGWCLWQPAAIITTMMAQYLFAGMMAGDYTALVGLAVIIDAALLVFLCLRVYRSPRLGWFRLPLYCDCVGFSLALFLPLYYACSWPRRLLLYSSLIAVGA